MKVLAINGSPRKTWNTAMLLEHALAGAASQGADTVIIHLYELNYKGCLSCFACKKRNGKSYGNCAVEDDLAPIFAKIKTSAALILGSPIYFGEVTGAMRSFMERLLFPYLVYSLPRQTLFPGNIRTGLIYTMNAPAEEAQRFGYDRLFKANERIMKMIFGHVESFMSYDTYQFEDYSKVVADGIDHERKKKRRQEIFPSDCQAAFEMGARMVQLPASR